MTFLARGRSVPTVQVSAPPGADMGNSAQVSSPSPGGLLGDQVAGVHASLQGRVSLTLLGGLIVGSVLFYMWTRDAQGS
jgi:hypothetical protein